jgi:cyclic beta-1,2-glucan synthetase
VTGLTSTREAALDLAARFSDPRAIGDAFDLAWVYSQIQMRHLNIEPEEAHLFQRLAARILYPDAALRAPDDVLLQNTRGQNGLWAYGLSGDNPILVARVDEATELDLVRQLLHAHEYWRLNNFTVDLVILNEHPTTYAEGLQGELQGLVDTSLSRPWQDKPGGVFIRRADHLPLVDLVLLLTAARVVLDGGLGSLLEQLGPPAPSPAVPPAEARPRPRALPTPIPVAAAPVALDFHNGLGGFTPDGREYVITLQPGQWTPAPWINVLANERFGCMVTDTGLGYTWAENSQQNRLTPWSNDPVSDPPGEVLYLRDDDTGAVWTPTPLPIREPAGTYTIAHGAGYTRYERITAGLAHELTVFVPPDDPVKVARLTLRNLGRQPRRLTVTGYVDWVLGTLHAQAQYFIVTERDLETGALLARNAYNADYPGRVAFLHLSSAAAARPRLGERAPPFASVSGDRTAFIGRNRSLANPAALDWPALDGRTGAGLDPCGATQLRVAVPAGGTIEVVLLLGQTHDAAAARDLVARFSRSGQAQAALDATHALWDGVLGTVQVETPDRALNHLLNRWLLYQALVCRIWGRSAFYQSGGAYGFRDQLQDVLALTVARPAVARAHLLRAAARQFVEGDAQHWWHPATGQGVRTRFSDDYLWLPYAVTHYVAATGDSGVLDEAVPFLNAPQLEADQHEAFVAALPGPPGSLYEHCRRALDHAHNFGPHGLPLMGIGDWNDGMNLVGAGGQGESVWLAWFLITNLEGFAELAEQRTDGDTAARYRATVASLKAALEAHAWDGAWYRRAYYDDGTPLGTAGADECQIDSIAQSWAVLSGAARAERAQQAMASLEEHLVREADGLVLLLTPPFNTTDPSPGYIQGYVPGIRENGGQYTHAALWAILAYVQQGNGERAAQLFRLINPIYHADTPAAVARYKVEPYVIAADVYSHPQHVGRGGWTWYTGSAAWMYRVGVEGLLGLRRHGDTFSVSPCIPPAWPGYTLTVTCGQARYVVEVRNPAHVSHGVQGVTLDGQPAPGGRLPFVDDGRTHHVVVTLGAA